MGSFCKFAVSAESRLNHAPTNTMSELPWCATSTFLIYSYLRLEVRRVWACVGSFPSFRWLSGGSAWRTGQVGEWLKPTDCKSVPPCEVRRFESFPVHQKFVVVLSGPL